MRSIAERPPPASADLVPIAVQRLDKHVRIFDAGYPGRGQRAMHHAVFVPRQVRDPLLLAASTPRAHTHPRVGLRTPRDLQLQGAPWRVRCGGHGRRRYIGQGSVLGEQVTYACTITTHNGARITNSCHDYDNMSLSSFGCPPPQQH